LGGRITCGFGAGPRLVAADLELRARCRQLGNIAEKLAIHESALDGSGQPSALVIRNTGALSGAKSYTEKLKRTMDERIAIGRKGFAARKATERLRPIALNRGARGRDYVAECGEIRSAPENLETRRSEGPQKCGRQRYVGGSEETGREA
jgi:hypothetical protein